MEMLKAAFTLHFDDRTKPSFAVSEARVLNHYDAPSVDKMLTVALTRENRSRRDYEVTSVRYFDNDFNAWVNVSLTDHHVHLREYEVHLEKIEKVAYTLIVFAIGVVFFFGHAPMTSVILIIVAVFYLWQNSRDRRTIVEGQARMGRRSSAGNSDNDTSLCTHDCADNDTPSSCCTGAQPTAFSSSSRPQPIAPLESVD